MSKDNKQALKAVYEAATDTVLDLQMVLAAGFGSVEWEVELAYFSAVAKAAKAALKSGKVPDELLELLSAAPVA